jgi:hypothetical protein
MAGLGAAQYVINAKKENGNNMLDKNNISYQIGRSVSVIVGQYEVTIDDDNYTYISNAAPGYAGMTSVLSLDQAPTNQAISVTPSYELSDYQLGKLTAKGYVTIKNSYTKGYVITDAVTMALTGSEFKSLSTVRIIGEFERLIRVAAEPFIGKVNSPATRNSLQTAINSQLMQIKDVLIQEYTLNFVTGTSEKLGQIYIDYKVRPFYEIKEVRNRITVKENISE